MKKSIFLKGTILTLVSSICWLELILIWLDIWSSSTRSSFSWFRSCDSTSPESNIYMYVWIKRYCGCLPFRVTKIEAFLATLSLWADPMPRTLFTLKASLASLDSLLDFRVKDFLKGSSLCSYIQRLEPI